MIKYFKQILSFFALCFIFNYSTYACTTFCISTKDELVFGKNYDWSISYGLVIVNKKDVVKHSRVGSNSTSVEWTSKYGSITFNQYGREFPSGGMNEAGLVIELMWLDETKFPDPDDRPVVNILQWIQYQLDNSASIDEIVASDSKIRISNRSVPVHYLAADKTGKTVSIEFLDGKMVYHKEETLPFKALTNDTYDNSTGYLKQFEGFGGNRPIADSRSSLDRFVKTCSMVKSYIPSPGRTAVDYGFDILKNVEQRNTVWSIIYDIKNLKVFFRTVKNSSIQYIDFSSLDFTCSSPVKLIDVTSGNEGNVSKNLSEYTYEANRELIENAYNGVEFLKDTPAEEKDEAAKFPESLPCKGKSEIQHEERIQKSSLDSGNDNVYLIITGIVLFSLIAIYIRKKK